jgi:hypothetical protein
MLGSRYGNGLLDEGKLQVCVHDVFVMLFLFFDLIFKEALLLQILLINLLSFIILFLVIRSDFHLVYLIQYKKVVVPGEDNNNLA